MFEQDGASCAHVTDWNGRSRVICLTFPNNVFPGYSFIMGEHIGVPLALICGENLITQSRSE